MNRGQLVFETSRSFGLDDTAGSDELLLMQTWANRGVVDILLKTRCYVDIGSMTLTIGVTDYRIDTSILAVLNITTPDQTGNPVELDVIQMVDILPFLSSTIAPTASPTYASVEGTLMRVAPSPTVASVLTYFYVPKPAEMTADATTGSDANDPSTATYGGIPTEFHDAILKFMAWQAAEYNQQGGGFYRGNAFAPGAAYEASYEKRCVEIRKQYRKKAGRGLSPARVGYPDRQAYPTRNDIYPRDP